MNESTFTNRLHRFTLLFLLLALLAPAMPASAAFQSNVNPVVITRAEVDFNTNQLTITGKNFGAQTPTVKLESVTLIVVSNSATQIVALLPAGTLAGTYLLTIRRKKGKVDDNVKCSEDADCQTFDFTIGVTGPRGEAGPQGTTGPQGAQGETGQLGLKGEAGPQGMQGDKGAKGDTGTQGAAGPKGDRGDTGLSGAQGPCKRGRGRRVRPGSKASEGWRVPSDHRERAARRVILESAALRALWARKVRKACKVADRRGQPARRDRQG